MTDSISRPYRGRADFPLLLEFARAGVAARPAGAAFFHPGDITWQFYNLAATEDVRLWFDAGGVAAFAAFEPPGVMTFDLRDGLGDPGSLIAATLAWGEARKRRLLADHADVPIAYAMLGSDTLSVEAFERDRVRIEALEAHGYRRQDRGSVRFRIDLRQPRPGPAVPPGMAVRHATDADAEERVDLHRDAWSMWGSSSATVDAYRRLRTAPNYEEAFDVVLEGRDGRLLSYCICWPDDASGIAAFEPVGTRAACTRQGLGRATVLGALARLRERGMRTATVCTASVNAPADALYRSCGFDVVGYSYYWSRSVAR